MAPSPIQSRFLAVALLACRLVSALRDPRDFVVYAFSQSDVDGEDPQVYELQPDVTIRAIGKWSNNGSEVEDYNFGQIARYHARNITFMGSGTASVIFPHDFPSLAIFDDMSTRDAEGNPVPHDELGLPIPARRGNLFNPAYRNYLLSWCKIQIDGGVDGINLDEVNGGFSGGQKHGFNGNEGFDDYTLADFNRYLLAKYPGFSAADWQASFGIDPNNNNTLSHSLPPEDLVGNFNYRLYLQSHNWSRNPLSDSNPLAKEWGKVTANRMYATDASFLPTYIRYYWTSIVTTLREYALAQHDRTLLISSNGLWPAVSFNSVGMYPWNPDEVTADYRGAEYVPVVTYTAPDGKVETHLNGAKSLKSQFRYLKSLHRQITGVARPLITLFPNNTTTDTIHEDPNPNDDDEVPVAIFIDWPNDYMAAYQSLPPTSAHPEGQEKQDYWRIFGAEAYANGLFPAFHLRDTVGGETAAESGGVLGFMRGYASFFRDNRDVFVRNVPFDFVFDYRSLERGDGSRNVNRSGMKAGEEVSFGPGSGQKGLVGSVLVQMGSNEAGKRRTVHVVNHNYERGVMTPVEGVVVEVDEAVVGGCPLGSVEVISPDWLLGEVRMGTVRCEGGKVRVGIGRVVYYSVLVFR